MLINSFFKVARVVPLSLRTVCLMSTNKQGGKPDKTWKDRDTAQEKDFFNKEDEKAMRKLLNKMRDTAAKQDPATHESEIKKSHEELNNLFRKHGVNGNEALYSDLVKWRFSS